MRLVFLGTGDFGAPVLRALLAAGHDVRRVISQPDRPVGRGQAVKPTAMHALADELGIEHVQAADVNAHCFAVLFGDVELGFVAAFGQKIGPGVLAAMPRGCVNLHGSLLPKYRGAAPYQRAILAGERVTGVTVFQLDERWDAGPIWARRETEIGDTETADELHDRLAVIGADAVVEALRLIETGEARPLPQDAAQASKAPKLSKADGHVDFAQPSFRVVRRIHGLWSWPAAACEFVSHTGKRERVQLARAAVVDESRGPDETGVEPGVFLPDLSVQTEQGTLRLLELKPAGGKLMAFEAFANGRRIRPGDRLARASVDAGSAGSGSS